MGLVTLEEILKDTRQKKYAVGSFNFNDFDDAYGMVQGASLMNSPIILMASTNVAAKFLGVFQCVKIAEALAEIGKIPVCLHLDHTSDMELIKKCVDIGFTSVMIDASQQPFEKNLESTKEVVEYAHRRGCSVEAELGKIGGREEESEVGEQDAFLTDPGDVEYFVEKTGVDALAVAIGTAHGFYKREPKIDFARLEKIASITECPLVLHGGTGVSDQDFRKVIELGISKINVGTELKVRFSDALKKAYLDKPQETDPRYFMRAVRAECCAAVQRKLEVFGSRGRAL